ncbi:ubiquinol-cytochrome C reductase complex core protein 2 [Dacryopinax primogenitus]|uniref:Cytochrome b-c1 complex subunit 2, mitochondrial n=1 Tax=Dacryopinax primogenitus (strain DJM 731) TaxID=1858805 RepID=M5FW42_DACPD|nr:ubiquinol-cytochrome C reductase complex core protein 2 [Dacryopinax primogenitus]EJU00584.1 ubiquinol-cytochrome C reductase complex core protein 2 [Dacryopinax primogenitus]
MLVQRRALAAAIRAHSSRTYATAPSGPTVFAQDNGQPTSSITVLVKAGSRFEPEGHAGIAHVLKHFSFKSSKERSALRTVREAELYGGILSATLTREYLALTADFLRGDEGFFLPLLASSVVSPKFVNHELHELVWPSVMTETANAIVSGEYTALELAHALAFRSGLGHALLNPPHAHAPSIEAVRDYASKAFTTSNVVIVGTGLTQEKLETLASHHFPLSSGTSLTSPATKYYGGSTVSPSLHPTLFVGYGIAGAPSAGLSTLAAHLAVKPHLPWSDGLSPLSSLPKSVSTESVLIPYSDATLFGVLISAKDSAGLRQGGEAVVKALKEAASGGLSQELAGRAKARAKFAAASLEEGKAGVLAKGAAQLEGKAWTNLVDQVEKLDVKALGKFTTDLMKTKPTVVALGDINTLPHADEIGL